jgi:hypothetical protein
MAATSVDGHWLGLKAFIRVLLVAPLQSADFGPRHCLIQIITNATLRLELIAQEVAATDRRFALLPFHASLSPSFVVT